MSNGGGTQIAARSLSSWRAWIEIQILEDLTGARAVALLMESVD